MGIISYRDMDLEQLYDSLDNAAVDSSLYRKLQDLIMRQQVETAMRSASAAERSAAAASRASWAAVAGVAAVWLTLLAALFF